MRATSTEAEADEVWAAASTVEEVSNAMCAFLDGTLPVSPWHRAPLNDESRPSAQAFRSMVNLGLIPTNSQPGQRPKLVARLFGAPTMREYVTGLIPGGHLVGLLSHLPTEPYRVRMRAAGDDSPRGAYAYPVTWSGLTRKPTSRLASMKPQGLSGDPWGLSPSLVKLLGEEMAVVEIVAREPGPSGLLGDVLTALVRGETERGQSPEGDR